MKRGIFVLLSLLLFVSFVSSLDVGDVSGEEDLEKIQDGIDKYAPIDEDGEVDLDKFKPLKSRAEERINQINAWLEKNASWLKVVFGMVPSISWHFLFNLWWMLFFIVVLILNANFNIGMIPGTDGKLDLAIIKPTYAQLIGALTFVLLLVFKTTVKLGAKLAELFNYIIDVVIPTGLVIGIILIVVLIVMLIFCPGVVVNIFKFFVKMKKKSAEQKAMQNQGLDRQILHRIATKAINDGQSE